MAEIHTTAVVAPQAKIGSGVEIGPYCVVGADVQLDDGVVLHSHVVVDGRTRVGARTQIFSFASIGHRPQDLKYHGEPSELVIGEDDIVREYVTMNPGTEGGGMVTRIGNQCLFMMGAHVAHDCQIGDGVILANNATLGGHVVIEDHAIIGGLAGVQQFVRIGQNSMVGAMSGVKHDIIPYGMATGAPAHLQGLNIIGLKRHGFSRAQIKSLNDAYKALFGEEDTQSERVDRVAREFGEAVGVGEIVSFIRAESLCALCQPESRNAG